MELKALDSSEQIVLHWFLLIFSPANIVIHRTPAYSMYQNWLTSHNRKGTFLLLFSKYLNDEPKNNDRQQHGQFVILWYIFNKIAMKNFSLLVLSVVIQLMYWVTYIDIRILYILTTFLRKNKCSAIQKQCNYNYLKTLSLCWNCLVLDMSQVNTSGYTTVLFPFYKVLTPIGSPGKQQICHFCSLDWHSLVIVPLLRTVHVVKHIA